MGFIDFVADLNANIVALANVMIAIGTVVLALGIPYAIKSASREERDTFYATLDLTYFEIQKLIIEHPHLSEPDPARKTPEQLIQYDAFAFIVWNFIEAIYDYSKQEKLLAVTWECILRYEAGVHGAWFRKAENRKKFKPEFIEHIEHGCLLPAASPSPQAHRR
ncbi:MAG: hypothetical protein KGL37_00310 [Acidobacteriota bacterium]|nr:hypothetical protein [Acidobacteriota bacterium]